MTKDAIIKYLLKEKVIKLTNGEYYPIVKSLIEAKTAANSKWCKNLPEKYKNLAMALTYEMFMEEAEIPIMVKSGDLEYQVQTTSLAAKKKLKAILRDTRIDFNILVSVIKSYYSSKVSKTGFAKLIETGNWLPLYNNPNNIEKPGNTTWK